MRGALIHRTAPQASRRQPVPATHWLTPGLPLRGRRPMTNPSQTVSEETNRRGWSTAWRLPASRNCCATRRRARCWSGQS